MNEGRLYVVATPIGNLDDLSPRAQDVLRTADLIAAEDTRVTGRLLSHFGIKTRQMSLHEHNETAQIGEILRRLEEGQSVALVSDAGTPAISDPGYRLLQAAHAAGVPVSPVPGPVAAIAALSVSGLPTDRFVFEGFLPARHPARVARLSELAAETRTLLFYESVHRIAATLADIATVFGRRRPAFVGRELTKLHEQCVAAMVGELAERAAEGGIPEKGEFVIVVAGVEAADVADEAAEGARVLGILVDVLPGRQAVEVAAAITGAPRNALYRTMLELGEER